jgi:hypothetical protein
MSVRFVTHCYAGVLPQYAFFLRCQLYSFYLLRRKFSSDEFQIVVCYTPNDKPTVHALNTYGSVLSDSLKLMPLTLAQLSKRAIGRHLTTINCRQDLIWFADADYLFRSEVLVGLRDCSNVLSYPNTINIQQDHISGDQLVNSDDETQCFQQEFVLCKYRKAIGGAQIVSGRWARENGYLPNSKWQKPHKHGRPFIGTPDDVAFRNQVGSQGTGIDLPGVYRLRHSRTTYQ